MQIGRNASELKKSDLLVTQAHELSQSKQLMNRRPAARELAFRIVTVLLNSGTLVETLLEEVRQKRKYP